MMTHPGNIGWRCNQTLAVTIVQCHSVGAEEGQYLAILH